MSSLIYNSTYRSITILHIRAMIDLFGKLHSPVGAVESIGGYEVGGF